jgi:hypothetical protein
MVWRPQVLQFDRLFGEPWRTEAEGAHLNTYHMRFSGAAVGSGRRGRYRDLSEQACATTGIDSPLWAIEFARVAGTK